MRREKNRSLSTLVLIDFETMELYSVQEQYTKKSIRDYTLWMAHTEDTLEINAVYTPVRTEAGKNAASLK